MDLIVRVQLLNSLPEDARVWVRERKAKTSEEAGELAENFLQARTTESEGRPRPNKERQAPPGICPKCGLPGHWASECPKNASKPENKPPSDKSLRPQEVRCYNCHEMGYLSYKCPKNARLYCDEGDQPVPPVEEAEVYHSGRVNGVAVEDIVLDTGAAKDSGA